MLNTKKTNLSNIFFKSLIISWISVSGIAQCEDDLQSREELQDQPGIYIKTKTEAAVANDTSTIASVEFLDTNVGDAIRILTEISGLNIIATEKARNKKVSLYLSDISIKDALESLASITGLWYRHNRETDVYILMTTEEYAKDIVVSRVEYTKTFVMKHHNVAASAEIIESLYGFRVTVTQPRDNIGSYPLDDGIESGGLGGSGGGRNSSGNQNGSRNQTNNSNSRQGNNGQNNELAAIKGLTSSQLNALQTDGAMVETINENLIAKVSQQLKASIYVTYNELHNLLFVRSSDGKALDSIAQLVKEIDKP
ncbi:MAG: hypothetical protein JKX98_11905, partial [Alcanivoracaceae bacterium]|nr:hypothetical protein [Alcanivoracaceae bacterium]